MNWDEMWPKDTELRRKWITFTNKAFSVQIVRNLVESETNKRYKNRSRGLEATRTASSDHWSAFWSQISILHHWSVLLFLRLLHLPLQLCHHHRILLHTLRLQWDHSIVILPFYSLSSSTCIVTKRIRCRETNLKNEILVQKNGPKDPSFCKNWVHKFQKSQFSAKHLPLLGHGHHRVGLFMSWGQFQVDSCSESVHFQRPNTQGVNSEHARHRNEIIVQGPVVDVPRACFHLRWEMKLIWTKGLEMERFSEFWHPKTIRKGEYFE